MTLKRSTAGMTGFLLDLARQSKKENKSVSYVAVESRGTPMSQAHAILEKAAGKGRVLSRSKAVQLLLSSPGFMFGKGETAMDFLERLNRRLFVTLGKDKVRVERWGRPWPKRTR
jgi:hypothetical protein